MKKITRTLCMLFIACTGIATQAIAEETNYMAGWDANGATDQTPYDAGWRTTSTENITWADCDPINADTYQYRDNLGVGRAFIHPKDHSVFSYPVKGLKEKTFYQFSCSSAKMSGNKTRPTTFTINTSVDGTGTILGSDTKDAAKWGQYTEHSFRFMPLNNGNYYLTWQTKESDGDRSLAFGFKVIELGTALTVTFNTNGGSTVDTQYLLAGANEKATQPSDAPTRNGYIFKGWYSDAGLTTTYDFSLPVITDITIYAKWQDIKEELKALVTTAEDLLNGGTEAGTTYLQTSIDAAKAIITNDTATPEEVTEAFNALTAAIAVYQDASLADLQIDGTTVSGFSATAYQYLYSLAPSVKEVPAVTANANAACAVVVINQASQLPGDASVVVTAGNGDVKTYTINFVYNQMAGWDADGATNKTPGDAGWLTTGSDTWDTTNAMAHCYRDNITYNSFMGRVLTTDYNNSIYAYPVQLTGGKMYQFTGRIGAINGGSNPASFNIDIHTTANKVDGVSLANRTYSIKQTTLDTYSKISFLAPATGTYYFTFQSTTGCRGLLANLVLIELPAISASNLSTFSDEALAGIQELALEGNFTVENITTLNAKLGANSVLTSIDLTKATVAADATDIFATLNPNALKYFAEGTVAPTNWANTVIGNTAPTIVLTDGYSFHNSKAFTAASISYQRTFAQGWSTFSLPFGIADISELGTIEKLAEVKENTIVFDAATEIKASNSYLINMANEAEKIFSANNVEVPVTVVATDIFKATFQKLTGTEAEGKLILVDEGETQKFEMATAGATIPAFRAYISLENPAPLRLIVEHKNNGATAIEKTNADKSGIIVYSPANGKITIEATINQYVTINNIDGRLLKTISLAEGESTTINGLAAGIYLINNQKIAIK